MNGYEDTGTGGRVGGGKKGDVRGRGGGGGGGEGGRRDVERGKKGERGSGGRGQAGTGGKKRLPPTEVADHEGRRKGNSSHAIQVSWFEVCVKHKFAS